MSSPITAGTWDGFAGAYYTGFGSTETLWLIVSIAMIVLAIWLGGRHEKEAYEAVEKK